MYTNTDTPHATAPPLHTGPTASSPAKSVPPARSSPPTMDSLLEQLLDMGRLDDVEYDAATDRLARGEVTEAELCEQWAPLAIPMGATVCVAGLSSRADLNGKRGRAVLLREGQGPLWRERPRRYACLEAPQPRAPARGRLGPRAEARDVHALL